MLDDSVIGNLYRTKRMWFGYKTPQQAKLVTWHGESLQTGCIFTILEIVKYPTNGAVPWNTTFYVAKILTVQGNVYYIKLDDQNYEEELTLL